MAHLRIIKPAFLARRITSSQDNIVNTTFTQVQFNTATIDTHSGWSAANYYYVIPWGWGGIWMFEYNIHVTSLAASGTRQQFAIYKDGANMAENLAFYAQLSVDSNQMRIEVPTVEGSNYSVWFWHAKGDNTPDILQTHTWFGGHYIGKS